MAFINKDINISCQKARRGEVMTSMIELGIAE
jgi:hypothetical protein